MPDGTKPAHDKKAEAQYERFKEAARALGCDEDEAAFDERLKAIARQRPESEAPRPTPARKTRGKQAP